MRQIRFAQSTFNWCFATALLSPLCIALAVTALCQSALHCTALHYLGGFVTLWIPRILAKPEPPPPRICAFCGFCGFYGLCLGVHYVHMCSCKHPNPGRCEKCTLFENLRTTRL